MEKSYFFLKKNFFKKIKIKNENAIDTIANDNIILENSKYKKKIKKNINNIG